MKPNRIAPIPALVAALALAAAAAPAAPPAETPGLVAQSARALPVVQDVDVVVVGGSSGGVAAACQAARAGAKVFLFTRYPYLGEDMAATLRLWLESDQAPASPLGKALFPQRLVTPMHVKRTLDQALIDAGVGFVFSSYATEVLRDDAGRLAGVVMTNRAGRQAVRARFIIDATERAVVARLAGAAFKPLAGGSQLDLTRVVVGGKPPDGPQVVSRKLPGEWFAQKQPHAACECTVSGVLAEASLAGWMRAEQRARTLTFHAGQLEAAERFVPRQVEALVVRKGAAADRMGPLEVDVEPLGVSGVYVLGPSAAANLGPEAGHKLLQPLALIDLGTRLGQAAAERAANAAASGPARAAALVAAAGAATLGQIAEPLAGLRPIHRDLPTVPSPACALPVLGRWDVVVVGGGTAGAAAGIGAARNGAKTLVLEYQHALGGVGTVGLIGAYWHGVREGFTAEVDRGVEKLQAKVKVLGKAHWWRQGLLDAGADVWLGVLGCGAVVEGGHVRGVVVASDWGRGVVLADAVIDATGSADIAAAAGARCAYVDGGDLSMQLAGLPGRQMGDSYVNTCYMFSDETDLADLTQLLVYAKDRFPAAFDLGTLVDTRERRRLVGRVVLTPVDLHAGRTWSDTVAVHQSNYDMYGFPVHPLYVLAAPPKKQVVRCRLPYRCLLPQGLEGLLVVGIGLSADRETMAIIRMQSDMQNLGFAAGLAAATAVKAGQGVSQVDVRAVQKRLVEMGQLPEDVLGQGESFPIGQDRLRAALAGKLDNLEDLAVVLSVGPGALPQVREAFARADGEEVRLNAARLLAALGDKTGLEVMLAALQRSPAWDAGQDVATSGENGSNYSRLDMLVLALGWTKDRRAVAPICEKARLLDARSPLSHIRAAAVALETLGDPAAGPTLAALLAQPGMTGHAIARLADARRLRGAGEQGQGRTVRLVNPALRELTLGRALFRCGDVNGLGRRILQSYEQDLQGPLARHAHAVLNGAP